MRWKMMKNLASGYWKTVVSHWRGCIFQGFQCLQKVWKTTPEMVLKCPQNLLKTGSQGSQKRSLKLQRKIKKTWWKKVSKMRSKKGIVLMILGTFLRSGSKGVPGWSQGPSQGQKSSKMGLKMTPKSWANVVRRLSENASQRHGHWACFQKALFFC